VRNIYGCLQDQVRPMLLRYMENVLVFPAMLAVQSELRAAGVTLITHGFSGNFTDWIFPMAQKIPMYYRFPGTLTHSQLAPGAAAAVRSECKRQQPARG